MKFPIDTEDLAIDISTEDVIEWFRHLGIHRDDPLLSAMTLAMAGQMREQLGDYK